jgi:hypothetical protein
LEQRNDFTLFASAEAQQTKLARNQCISDLFLR